MRVPVGDVELYVHEKGEGRPLVALHGGPGLDGSVWFPGLDPLADEGWWILAVDHRGNGRSGSGDPVSWTVPQMADDVQAVIERLGLAEPVVIGWSFGTFVAQAHMVRHRFGLRSACDDRRAERLGARARPAHGVRAGAAPRAGDVVVGARGHCADVRGVP